MLFHKKTWFTEAVLQNVNSSANKCKIFVNYYFLEGREALHAYLLPYIFIYSFPPAVNNLKQVFQLAMVVYISAFQRFLKSSHFDTYSPTI